MTSRNFLGLSDAESLYETASAVILPCPYERTTSYLKGTKAGPEAILEASEQVEFLDSETQTQAFEKGIHTFPVLDYQTLTEADCLSQTEDAVARVLKANKFPVLLGGEHTISLSAIRASAKILGAGSLSILHFDAHSDMRNAYEGNPYSHACVLRRAHEVIPRSYSVGIRAQAIEEVAYLRKNAKAVGLLYDHERYREGILLEKALAYLPTKKIYITFDLDYLSPQEMPSVGTPVPGGGNWYEVLSFLRQIYEVREVVGVDVVELRPDKNYHSNFLAAQLVYKLITYKQLPNSM